MVYGGGADPLKLKFDCSRYKPTVKITLLEIHPEHLPKRLTIHKPMKIDGKIQWTTELPRMSERFAERLSRIKTDKTRLARAF